MSFNDAARAVARLYDAAQSPDDWPDALRSVAEAVGVSGASYLIREKQTSVLDWISVTGPLLEMQSDYIHHFADKDLYAPILYAAECGRWIRMTQVIPETDLRASDWYNECLLRSGIDDALGVKLFEDDRFTVVFGVHHGTDSSQSGFQKAARIRALWEPLARAARLHVGFRSLNRKLTAANDALHHLLAGVILTDPEGRVLEVNGPADRILQLNDGLLIKNGVLVASRAFEAAKLSSAIAAASGSRHAGGRDSHLLVGRRNSQRSFIVSVFPHHDEGRVATRSAATVLVINPDWQTPSERSVGELFGLSPAESRLAASLTRGRKLSEIAWDTGVEITTLRTQLSSILRKVGVDRQVDLVQTLSSIGFATSHADQ